MEEWKYKIPEGIILKRICGKNILVVPRKLQTDCSVVTEINDVAALIFEMIKEGEPEYNIVEKICQDYLITSEKAAEDVQKFCNVLTEKGLLIRMEKIDGGDGRK